MSALTELRLPELPGGLNPEWMTDALRQCGLVSPSTQVAQVVHEHIGEGTGMMSELVRLRLTYSSGEGPEYLVAKYSSTNANNRDIAMSFNLYERETRYFAELDEQTSAVSPATYISARNGDHFLILMEDMSDYRIGDQAAGADLEDSSAMLDELVKLHSAFWDNVAHLDWIPQIAGSYHADNMDALVRVGWPVMADTFSEFIDADVAARGDAFIAVLPALQAAMNIGPVTLLHGDFRMENVFFGTQPEHHPVAIIDWQGPLRGKAMVDVALILGHSTRTEVRRTHEQALIQGYAAGLEAAGVQGYADQAWHDYQLAMLYNWVYVGVVAGTLDTTNEKGFAWMSQMVARQNAATQDLDLFRLLPD